MTLYRDLLSERFDTEIGSVVGCGLDRLERPASQNEIILAVEYFNDNKVELEKLPLSGRRGCISDLFAKSVNNYL